VLKAMQEDRELQGIPVIVLTAQRLNEEEIGYLMDGVSAVLSKGIFTAEETLGHIEQALTRHRPLGSETQRLTRKVMAYIHEHFDQPISRKDLADYAGVSERHLNRCFLEETGLSPLNYLNRYRVQQAKLLLEGDRWSVMEVMCKVGFSDSSHFARVFRREAGISPSAYKKKCRRN
jgi:AraC-like DNA-binding protein